MGKKRCARVVRCIVLAVAALLGVAYFDYSSESTALPVGIYAGPSTWIEGRQALQHFLAHLGLAWQEFTAEELDRENLSSRFRALWFPGGWGGDYQALISRLGKQRIREFIAAGGAYFGSSAGAYFACDYVVWQGNRYEYDLDLFNGYAEGPLDEIAPWPQWTFTPVRLDTAHPANEKMPLVLPMLFFGEPDFHPSTGQAMEVLGRWALTGTPGLISFSYGKGTVVLLGPHPEIGYDHDSRNWDVNGGHGAQWAWLAQVVRWALNPL